MVETSVARIAILPIIDRSSEHNGPSSTSQFRQILICLKLVKEMPVNGVGRPTWDSTVSGTCKIREGGGEKKKKKE